jgi:hypothetical protein
MIIATDNDDLAAVGDAAVREHNDGEAVEFSADGRARVRAAVGELLVESRAGIEVVDDERSGGDDS